MSAAAIPNFEDFKKQQVGAGAGVPSFEDFKAQQNKPLVPGAEKTGLPTAGAPPKPLPELSGDNPFLSSPNGLIRGGLHQIEGGMGRMLMPGRNAKYEGATDIIKGAGSMLAPVAIGATIPAAVAAPAATIGGLGLGAGGSYLGGKGARSITAASGGSPQAQDLAETGGNLLGGVVGGLAGAKGMPKLIDAIPNAERAGRNFELVNAAAKHMPVDLTAATTPALRAQELARTGPEPPPVMTKFLNRIPQHNSEPMLFPEARDFQSNAGRLSAADKIAATPQMGAQVSALAKALGEANSKAAESAGVGPLYESAMKEYRQAMKLSDFKDNAADIAKQIAKKALIYGPGVALGGYGAKKILDGVIK